MSKNKLPLIFTLLLGITTCLLIQNRSDKILEGLKNENSTLDSKINLLYNNLGIQLYSEDTRIPTSTKVINLEGDTTTLKEVLTSKANHIVFRYSDSHCQLCIDQEFENLNLLSSEVTDKRIKVIGLTNFKNLGSFRNYQKLKKVRFDAYNLVDNFPLELEHLNIPYIFILRKEEMVANVVFVPSKDMPENSFRYYQIIKDRYSRQLNE